MSKYRRPRHSEKTGPSGQRFGITVTELIVGAWCPTPDGSGPAQAVGLQIMTNKQDLSLFMRIKTPAAVDELITALRDHQRYVWPDYQPEDPGL